MRRLFMLICCFISFQALGQSINVKTYIPPRAIELMPIVLNEADRLMPNIIHREYFMALGEQESCIHLKHPKCFNPKAELFNSREQGSGIFQLTRAWDVNGKLRFDTLQSLRNQYRDELRELSWDNIKLRPELQIRSMILLVRSSYVRYQDIPDTYERLKFVDPAYNGGDRDVGRARSACKLAAGCNPKIWFNNVERYNPKSLKPFKAYGNKSLRQINNEHVSNVFNIRIHKYKAYIDTHFAKSNNVAEDGKNDNGQAPPR